MISLKQFTFNPFAENTYIVHNNAKACLIIDPGCSNAYEIEQVTNYIEKKRLNSYSIIEYPLSCRSHSGKPNNG